MQIKEILAELKKPFPPEDHQERKLPGGGRWLFIPWQKIRDRLDEVYPAWQISYSEPGYLGDYCWITCTITIEGVSRSAPGNTPTNEKGWGTPIERAIADSFKNAAEAWGVGRYLDDQKFVISYLKGKGDYRAEKFWLESEQIKSGVRGQAKPQNQTPAPFGGQQLDRDLLLQEIDSLIKRKSIDVSFAQKIAIECTGVGSRSRMTENQLLVFKNTLATYR